MISWSCNKLAYTSICGILVYWFFKSCHDFLSCDTCGLLLSFNKKSCYRCSYAFNWYACLPVISRRHQHYRGLIPIQDASTQLLYSYSCTCRLLYLHLTLVSFICRHHLHTLVFAYNFFLSLSNCSDTCIFLHLHTLVFAYNFFLSLSSSGTCICKQFFSLAEQ